MFIKSVTDSFQPLHHAKVVFNINPMFVHGNISLANRSRVNLVAFWARDNPYFLSRCNHLAIALDLYALSADSLSVLLLSVLKGNGIASIVGISVLISFTFAGNATGLDTAILFSSMITDTLVLLQTFRDLSKDFDQPRQCQLRF